MTKIFISYRRQDTRLIAGRVFDRLAAKFGHNEVFMDVEGIPFGVNFHGYLNDEVAQAEIVLALIGHGWADAKDAAGKRRLDDPDDFVRIEIEAAIRLKKVLGAVLIDNAPMPQPGQLPDSLRPLTRQHAAFVDAGKDFHPHMDRLIADLERHLDGKFTRPRVTTSPQPATSRERDKAQAIKPGSGESFKDIISGPEMVVVPAGEFLMGSPQNEPERFGDEGPQHKVIIPHPFAVGRHAVTFDEWDAAVADGACNGYKPADEGWGRGRHPVINVSWDDAQAYVKWLWRHPVINVSWDDAQAYVKWLSGKTGKDYRLLSEAEWEYAARAGTTTRYWWGDEISKEQANYDSNTGKTVPVNTYQPNPWGLYQVHGNVWEWCEDVWHDSYNGAPDDGSARTDGQSSSRVLRGGSWDSLPWYLRSAYRLRNHSDIRGSGLGFRVSRTLTL